MTPATANPAVKLVCIDESDPCMPKHDPMHDRNTRVDVPKNSASAMVIWPQNVGGFALV